MSKNWTRYLLWFAQEHINFRFQVFFFPRFLMYLKRNGKESITIFQEIESLTSMLKIKMRFIEEPTHEVRK